MTYGFRCGSCGREFEITATVSEYETLPPPRCPGCGAPARRVFTPVLVMSAARGSGDAPPSGGCCGGACGCRH